MGLLKQYSFRRSPEQCHKAALLEPKTLLGLRDGALAVASKDVPDVVVDKARSSIVNDLGQVPHLKT